MKTVSPLPRDARQGVCVSCGSGPAKREYFDLKVFIEFEGALYICDRCVVEMAYFLGMVKTEQHENVKRTNQQLLTSNKELRERNEELTATVDRLSKERVVRAEEHRTEVERARIQATQETEKRYAGASK